MKALRELLLIAFFAALLGVMLGVGDPIDRIHALSSAVVLP